MAKSFVCRRTPRAMAVEEDTIGHFRECSHRAEKQYGRYSPEAWEARVALAVMYCAAENYADAVPLLTGYEVVEKGKQGPNPMWMFWAGTLLVEAYFNLGRIPEAMRISNQGRSIAKDIDPSASDPLIEALLEQATGLEAKGDLRSRQRGFVAALMTLCWYVSHGFDRSHADAHVQDRLQVLFKSYGFGDEEWEWTIKHAHLTKYDFIGLLSILLHRTGLAPSPLRVVARGSHRVIEVC